MGGKALAARHWFHHQHVQEISYTSPFEKRHYWASADLPAAVAFFKGHRSLPRPQ